MACVCDFTDATVVKEPVVVEEQGTRYSMRTRQAKGGDNKENGVGTGNYYHV